MIVPGIPSSNRTGTNSRVGLPKTNRQSINQSKIRDYYNASPLIPDIDEKQKLKHHRATSFADVNAISIRQHNRSGLPEIGDSKLKASMANLRRGDSLHRLSGFQDRAKESHRIGFEKIQGGMSGRLSNERSISRIDGAEEPSII